MNQSARKSWAALALLLGASATVTNLGFAQPAAQAEEPVTMLEKFEVTGSYIPIAGAATAIPVTVLSTQAIADTGINTNLLEVLRKAAPQFSGNGNLGNTNANIASGSTGGGSQVAFRNTQTLVLVNGRRSAYAPILSSGGYQFVDVNLIPISAVERIEILQDGASALYGTDAVAGVVNIILKSDFKGFETGGRYSFSDNDGNYAERKFWVVGGTSTDTTGITISAEWTKSDPLFQYERPYSNPSYGTPTFAGVVNIGGTFYILNPSLNAPPLNQDLTAAQLVANGTYIQIADVSNFINGQGADAQYSFNLAQYVTLLLGNERQSATINFDHRWFENVNVFGDFMYAQTKTYSQLNAQPTSAAIAGDNPFNPFNVTVRARNRFLQFPRQYFYDTTNVRGVIGVRGSIGDDWRWEAAALNNRVEQSFSNPGLIDSRARGAAISGNVLNYFARQQPAGAIEASGMFGTALGQAVSELATYDARISGRLFDLPAGEVGFAVGVDWRTEKLSQTADRNSQTATFGWDTATTLDPFKADRHINSAFLNVRVPVFGSADGKGRLLELEGAVRHEKYSDTDDPTVPKVSFRWLPVDDQLAVRGTYSESFAAPTLFQLFGPGGVGFTHPLALQRFGGGSLITGQANARSGANPNLRPSEAEGMTLGVVWSPRKIKGFSATLNYFNVEQTDLISTIGTATILQSVELNGTASPYAQFVRFGPRGDTSMFTAGTPVTAAGQIGRSAIDEVYVTNTLVNIARQKLAGFDVAVNYTWNSDTWGRFDSSLVGIWWEHYRARTLPGTAEFDTVGQATDFNGTIPEYQAYFSTNWSRGNWGGTFGWTYIPSVEDVNAYDPTDSTADAHVEAFHSVDLSVRYTFGSQWRWLNGLTMRVGANNVFNEMPPSAKGTFTQANADTATYGAIGRLFFIEARYSY